MKKRVTEDIGIYLLPSSKVVTDMSYCNVKKKTALFKKNEGLKHSGLPTLDPHPYQRRMITTSQYIQIGIE